MWLEDYGSTVAMVTYLVWSATLRVNDPVNDTGIIALSLVLVIPTLGGSDEPVLIISQIITQYQ